MIARALVLLVLATSGCGAAEPAPEAAPPARREPLPPTKVDGDALAAKMSEASGHVRLFNFWATWCQPCVAEMPILRTFARHHPEAEVILVNVDHAQVQGTRVPKAIEQHQLDELGNLLLASDDPNQTLKQHVRGWPEQIPVTVIVGPDGHVLETHIEAVDGPTLEAAMARATGG